MKFNWEQYKQWDDWGKSIVINWLTNSGHIMVHNPDKYGIDLYSDYKGKLYLWEVEVSTRRLWTCEEDYKYDTVSFLGRKKKWDTWPFFYCIICSQTRAVVMCVSTTIFKEEYKQTRYVVSRDEMDEFYDVPKELCTFIHI